MARGELREREWQKKRILGVLVRGVGESSSYVDTQPHRPTSEPPSPNAPSHHTTHTHTHTCQPGGGPPGSASSGHPLRYIFGVGAESRGTPVNFPEPYAYIAHGNETWTANIHLLRTQELNTTAFSTKACVECAWTPFKEAQQKRCTASQSKRIMMPTFLTLRCYLYAYA